MTKGQEWTSTGIDQTTVSTGFQLMLCFLCGTDRDESTEGLTGLETIDHYRVPARDALPLCFEQWFDTFSFLERSWSSQSLVRSASHTVSLKSAVGTRPPRERLGRSLGRSVGSCRSLGALYGICRMRYNTIWVESQNRSDRSLALDQSSLISPHPVTRLFLLPKQAGEAHPVVVRIHRPIHKQLIIIVYPQWALVWCGDVELIIAIDIWLRCVRWIRPVCCLGCLWWKDKRNQRSLKGMKSCKEMRYKWHEPHWIQSIFIR